ncbi:MAG: PilZ domain-containing protein, partial [Candidatus Aminicenantes bacterium]|nr:PilZ domain-containing protein [Candidatus Aminicenantes bacterium]
MKGISKEDGFNVTLPMLVEGNEVFGKKFKEKTFLLYISNYGASFWLKTSVSLGSELKIIINLPPKLAEDKNL